MRSKTLAALLVPAVILASAGTCGAQGTSGSQFLGIGMGARSTGMGGASVSLADDGTALYWNPGALTLVGGHRFTVSHVAWFRDATYRYASYALPLGESGVVGLAVEQGGISWDNTGEGEFDAGDFSGALGYGRAVLPNLGVGGSLKYLSSVLGDDSAASYAVDVGAIYKLSENVSLGAAVRNLGPGLSYREREDPLPTTLAVGGSCTWRDLTLALDLEKQNDLAATPRAGLEYVPIRPLALRGGFIGGDDSALGTFTGGFGLRWADRWAFDYAYRPSTLGGTHQVGLSAGLGGGGGLLSATSVASEGGVAVSAMPKSNLSVITELVRETISEAVDRMGLAEGSEVYVALLGQNDASWLVQSVLYEELTADGHAVMAGGLTGAGEEGGPTRYEVAYRIVSCETSFPRAWREWVVGSRRVERKTRCDIHFRLSDARAAVVWAGSVERERREIIPGDRLTELSTQGQPFASPEITTGGWDRVLEPVVVAGIVGGLIYLFYTSRSTN
jgi:hypothetical protein